MQRIFLEPGPWFGPPGLEIIPNICALADHAADRVLFTRFITAQDADHAKGAWQRYYRHWDAVTQQKAGSEILRLHSDLARRARAENVYDKITHDAFDNPAFGMRLAEEGATTVVLSGVETDVCVLATALSAVDLGYRVIIATDAVASSAPASHDACLAHVYPRFDQQVELALTADIIAQWSLSCPSS